MDDLVDHLVLDQISLNFLMEQYTSKKRVPPHVPKRDFVAITDDHRKEVNRDLRVYNAEKSHMRCIEKKMKQEKLNEQKEVDLEYKLIGKHLKAIELQKVSFCYCPQALVVQGIQSMGHWSRILDSKA